MAWGSNLPRVDPNQFKDLGTGTITFENSAGGMKATLETDGGIFFAGRRIESPHFSDADLVAYAGEYKSTELDVTYDLSIEQGNLLVRSKWNPPIRLTPVVPDEFESEEFNVVFQRDSHHRISGLRVFTVQARDLSFERVR